MRRTMAVQAAEVVLPKYIRHEDSGSSSQHMPIYSLHIHPDGSRVATGGQDGMVSIWSTQPIRDRTTDVSAATLKLASMQAHEKCTSLCVRFSSTGLFLASAGDNKRIVVFKKTDAQPNRFANSVFAGVRIESWVQHAVLHGHDGDILHLEWSPDGRYLASCSTSTEAIVWDAQSFKLVKRITHHDRALNGLAWDPAGKFLCTKSNDRTIKIWRTYDWTLEKTVSSPFRRAPDDLFVNRLSWSPDADSILVPNATNGSRRVVAAIKRSDFSANTFVVPNFEPCLCASYCPVIFKGKDGEPYVISAIGGRLGSLTVWQSRSPRPLAGFRLGFMHAIHDISWFPDGSGVLACSFDGTVKGIMFDTSMFGTPLTLSETNDLLRKYGNKRFMEIPESIEQLELENSKKAKVETTIPEMTVTAPSIIAKEATIPQAPPVTEKRVQLVEVKDGKKRISPILLQSADAPASSLDGERGKNDDTNRSYSDLLSSKSIADATLQFNSFGSKTIPSRHKLAGHHGPMMSSKESRNIVKNEVFSLEVLKGGVNNDELIVLRDVEYVLPSIIIGAEDSGANFSIPAVKSSIVSMFSIPADTFTLDKQPEEDRDVDTVSGNATRMSTMENGDVEVSGKDSRNAIVTCKNSGGSCTVSLQVEGKVFWRSEMEKTSAVLVAASEKLIAVATLSGSLSVYSICGLLMLPPLMLQSPALHMAVDDSLLLVITSNAMIYAWDIDSRKSFFMPHSIAHILGGRGKSTIKGDKSNSRGESANGSAEGLKEGDSVETSKDNGRKLDMDVDIGIVSAFFKGKKVILVNSFYETYVYDTDGMEAWLKVGDRDDAIRAGGRSGGITHVEHQLNVSRVLGSSSEYRHWLHLYVRLLSDEGDATRIAEILNRLLCAGGQGDSYILDLPKHELLLEILPIVAQNRALQRLAAQYAEALRLVTQGN